MLKSVKKQMLALPVALGLLGGAFVALPAQAAVADDASAVVVKAQSELPALKGRKVTVRAGELSVLKLTEQGPADGLTFKFRGYPLKGITLEDNYLVFNLPETQREGLHRVTVRVSNGRQSASASYIINILPAQSK